MANSATVLRESVAEVARTSGRAHNRWPLGPNSPMLGMHTVANSATVLRGSRICSRSRQDFHGAESRRRYVRFFPSLKPRPSPDILSPMGLSCLYLAVQPVPDGSPTLRYRGVFTTDSLSSGVPYVQEWDGARQETEF